MDGLSILTTSTVVNSAAAGFRETTAAPLPLRVPSITITVSGSCVGLAAAVTIGSLVGAGAWGGLVALVGSGA